MRIHALPGLRASKSSGLPQSLHQRRVLKRHISSPAPVLNGLQRTLLLSDLAGKAGLQGGEEGWGGNVRQACKRGGRGRGRNVRPVTGEVENASLGDRTPHEKSVNSGDDTPHNLRSWPQTPVMHSSAWLQWQQAMVVSADHTPHDQMPGPTRTDGLKQETT